MEQFYSKFIENLAKEQRNKMERRKIMRTTTEYMDWIEKFTKIRGGFGDKEFDYDKSISDQDFERVKLLDEFYSIISEYADKNYIDEKSFSSSSFCYNLEYNNIFYEIGLDVGQGGNNWIVRIDTPQTEIIHFTEVMNDILRNNAYEIKKFY